MPTPSQSPITLRATLVHPTEFRLRLYDTQGREVYTSTYHLEKGQYLLPLGYVGAGMYLLHIDTPQGKLTQKVLVLP
ncbi:MAG: T9SS type A sorting domain-containing protein [Bacteroidia bacterium]